ncbi:hypothetical protein T440DRAFT_220034 [Plenodomus tracheiphilus IPT5]|uniref:Uncharacterized protein n=1 Tax=Plenodomus tracheiphilus IPT5 TaxID=1408161 RepID=A0A6A7AVK6_9PLEO|nr:hypothetical protein T440DRAFT_220034 [Plenodomus tracheiphilus IPT5]
MAQVLPTRTVTITRTPTAHSTTPTPTDQYTTTTVRAEMHTRLLEGSKLSSHDYPV